MEEPGFLGYKSQDYEEYNSKILLFYRDNYDWDSQTHDEACGLVKASKT